MGMRRSLVRFGVWAPPFFLDLNFGTVGLLGFLCVLGALFDGGMDAVGLCGDVISRIRRVR